MIAVGLRGRCSYLTTRTMSGSESNSEPGNQGTVSDGTGNFISHSAYLGAIGSIHEAKDSSRIKSSFCLAQVSIQSGHLTLVSVHLGTS